MADIASSEIRAAPTKTTKQCFEEIMEMNTSSAHEHFASVEKMLAGNGSKASEEEQTLILIKLAIMLIEGDHFTTTESALKELLNNQDNVKKMASASFEKIMKEGPLEVQAEVLVNIAASKIRANPNKPAKEVLDELFLRVDALEANTAQIEQTRALNDEEMAMGKLLMDKAVIKIAGHLKKNKDVTLLEILNGDERTGREDVEEIEKALRGGQETELAGALANFAVARINEHPDKKLEEVWQELVESHSASEGDSAEVLLNLLKRTEDSLYASSLVDLGMARIHANPNKNAQEALQELRSSSEQISKQLLVEDLEKALLYGTAQEQANSITALAQAEIAQYPNKKQSEV